MERDPSEAATEKPVAVYRAYDLDGQLLYVGTSIDPDARMKSHKHTSPWWHLHSWLDVRWFPNSLAASTEEFSAICAESPRFNTAGIKTAYFPHNVGSPRRHDFKQTKRYLSVTNIADRTGLTLNTIKTYSQIPGRLPMHDCMIGRVKGWLPETIDAWMAQRKR